MFYFIHLLKIRYLFIIKSIKFYTLIPRAGNPFSSPGVSCLWHVQEAHGCLTKSLQRKSILSARRNHPPPLLLQPWLHCRAAKNRESIKLFSQKKWYSGQGPWQRGLRLCGQFATKASNLVTGPVQGITTESEVHCQFGSGFWECRRTRTLLLPNASSTSDASDTSITDL